jgi:maltose-binding protein MalE
MRSLVSACLERVNLHRNHLRPEATEGNMENVEFRIMPSDDEGNWYWEVIKNGHQVVARGVADTEPAACQQANEAAQKAKLIP